jgi:hypothetical protein
MITQPGIYDLPEHEYHADPCPAPSLSASIARKLVRQSPMHAWHAHPRLNPNRERDDGNDASNAGTILHKMLLGKGAEIAPIAADDWRTKAAKEAREAARAAGLVPVLKHKLDALHECAAAARKQIMAHPDGQILFEPGQPERAMVWREGETWCRSLVDWMPDDPALPLIDIKTTGMSAAPGEWERRLITEYALQEAFYRRGARALGRTARAPMLFVVIECEAPFGVSVMTPAPSLQVIAEHEVDKSIRLWGQCMSTNAWPGYPPFTAHIEAPTWRINQMEMEMMEAAQ